MSKPEFNPARYLRERNPDKLAKLTAGLTTATLQELREANARRFAALVHSEKLIAGLWAINLEFTRRGIGPRWRGIEGFNPSAVPHALPFALPAGAKRLHRPAMLQKLLLRWADLQWLQQELGPSHRPANLAWSSMFASHIDDHARERLFAHVAESVDKPHRIVHGLSIDTPHRIDTPRRVVHGVLVDRSKRASGLSVIGPITLTLKGFAVAKAGDRCRAVKKRLKDVIQPRLDALATRPTYTPTADQIAKRLVYAEAIELAQGRPTETARFVRWISGEVVTPQAAERMRNKIASDLALLGRAWKAAGS